MPSDFDSCASHLSVDVKELREENGLQMLPPHLAQHLHRSPWMFLFFRPMKAKKRKTVTD
jgi:hypothetical protein